MAELAIKGHETRGKEIIELLEMMGGTNKIMLSAHIGDVLNPHVYFFDSDSSDNRIVWNYLLSLEWDGRASEMIIFTLEEFLEKFPYKVGDKVRVWSQHDDEFFYGSYSYESKTIKSMRWNETLGKVAYTIEGINRVFYKEELKPYKEEEVNVNYTHLKEDHERDYMKDNKVDLTLKGETMEDKDVIEHTTEINLNHPCFDGHNKIELIIPENWKFEQRGNKMFGIRKYPQYPKTYEGCCEVLMGKTDFPDFELVLTKISINRYEGNSISPEPPHISLINNFYKLLICRDAYWKIAGEEMGLDKSWKSDWKDDSEIYYTISYKGINIKCYNNTDVYSKLAFPTAEMRDAFYDNFKDLIESCKELL